LTRGLHGAFTVPLAACAYLHEINEFDVRSPAVARSPFGISTNPW
jgi:hypothetical protein